MNDIIGVEKMKIKFRYIIVFSLLIFSISFLGAFVGVQLFGKSNSTPSTEKVSEKKVNEALDDPSLQKILQTFQLIQEHFIHEVDDELIYEGAIQGMLDVLDDPNSEYMNVEAMERFEEQINSSFEGIGAEVTLREGKVTIVSPIKDSPAEKAGLRPNDIILEVDGESLEGLELFEAVEQIRGEKGSEVTISVQRSGSSKPFDVKLIRDDIPVETVYKDIVEEDGHKTGYLTITSFADRTAAEFEEYLQELEEEGMDGLVIDVRGNPGGRLDSVEQILEHFIPKDKPYIQTEDKDGNVDKLYTNTKEKKPYPITTIIDEGSASASEILAVTLKENGYDVVGTTSFGKGTVQQTVPLGDGSTVKLTFYKWLSPEGNWINDVGVEPTIEQKQPDYYYVSPVDLKKALKVDDVGDNIETIQVMLHGIGYTDIREDGYFDEEMKSAVEAFQKENDIKVTGSIDEETYGKIEAEIVDRIREQTDDLQLKKALNILYES